MTTMQKAALEETDRQIKKIIASVARRDDADVNYSTSHRRWLVFLDGHLFATGETLFDLVNNIERRRGDP